MESIVNFFIERSQGVDPLMVRQMLQFIVLVPVVATIISILRYIVGLRTLTPYAPLLLTFVFFKLSYISASQQNFILGFIIGLFLFLAVCVFSIIFYLLTKGIRLHYVSKLSLIITGLSMIFVLIIVFFAYLDVTNIIYAGPLTIVIAILLGESIMAMIAKKNVRFAVIVAIETLITSGICYIIISINVVSNLFYNWPLSILIVILLNIVVGRFLGLRLTEYIRFRKIIFREND